MNIKKSTSTALLSVAPDIWGIAAIEIVKYILSFDKEFSRFYASIFTIACASLGLSGCRRTRKAKVWTALSRYWTDRQQTACFRYGIFRKFGSVRRHFGLSR